MKRLVLGLSLLLAACATPEQASLSATPIAFSALSGWQNAETNPALPVFLRSCQRLSERQVEAVDFLPTFEEIGTVNDDEMQALCLKAALVMNSGQESRNFFERHFTPIVVERRGDKEALFTGYFEPIYAAKRQDREGLVPVLTKPDDLITANLGDFLPEFAGQGLTGRVENGRFIPYPTHEEIVSTPPEASSLGYVDPNDLLFLQIQGSGRLEFPDGEVARVGYAGKNGHPYVAIGRTLINDGALTLEQVSMDSIRAWLADAPATEAARVRHSNPSYVFFRPLDNLPEPDLGPLGAQGVQLTPHYSLALDDEIYGYGLPVWVEMEGEAPLRRLFIAQDTGGAIIGAQRADLFFGAGDVAGELAGGLKSPGRMVVFVPNAGLSDGP